MPFDLYHLLQIAFSWTTLLRLLLLLLGLYLCARAGTAIAERTARHPVPKRLATAAVWATAAFCLLLFPLRLAEDYAYAVLGGECFSEIPDAMRWLEKNGRESRLVRTVRAPSRQDDIAWNNTRFFAALVLARKNPEKSRTVLTTVPPFERTAIDQSRVIGTNRYTFPLAGAALLSQEAPAPGNPPPQSPSRFPQKFFQSLENR